jgi:hypothetical protein
METRVKQNQIETLIALCLIILGALLRIIPHPANFAPVAAIAIFGGVILPKRLALITPLMAMILSDAMIGFHSLIWVTWGCYLLIALSSHHWLKKPRPVPIALLTVSGSLFFFVATNLAVWQFSGMYMHSAAGLTRCFSLAVPFFRNTFLSDCIFTSSLFGIYYLALWFSGQHYVIKQIQN